MSAYPVLMHTALDATDCAAVGGDLITEAVPETEELPVELRETADDDSDWLVLLDPTGHRVFAFQQVPALARPTFRELRPTQSRRIGRRSASRL